MSVPERVVGVLEEALNIDSGKIALESSLQGDLGAESIDYLDIVFRLEREFNIKIPRDELFPEHIFGDADCVDNGVISDVGITKLEQALPFSDFKIIKSDPKVENMHTLFTVSTLIKFVEHKLRG